MGKHVPDDWGTVASSGYGLMVVKTTDSAADAEQTALSGQAPPSPTRSNLLGHTDLHPGSSRTNRRQSLFRRRRERTFHSPTRSNLLGHTDLHPGSSRTNRRQAAVRQCRLRFDVTHISPIQSAIEA